MWLEKSNLTFMRAGSQKSENLHFDQILLSKACKDLDEKKPEELCFITSKSDAKFEEKQALFTSIDYFCPKYMRFELKKIQRSYLSWH